MKKSYITYTEDEGDLYIEEIYVDKSERRQGKGFQLLNEAKEEAKKEGLKRLTVCVSPTDDMCSLSDLIEFYQSYGFEVENDNGDYALMNYTIF